ncbi:YbaB/EbfC family nucleoid-associated protein [Micromonospora sp. NPDC050417]|uniref:YbaB/EbfC family nucleoid-associated protein n=1 Tax=Micromonospora sp. NPDC050417 TaxID=3364280 RepID=UPI00379D7F2B
MSSPLHDRFEQAFTEFEEQKVALSDFERKLAESSKTVTAKNRAVSVTVDGQGDLMELKFPTNAYRTMAPAELSSLLVETIREAREQARASTTEMLETYLPGGMASFDMLNNPIDFEEILGEALRTADRMFSGMPSNTDRTEESR